MNPKEYVDYIIKNYLNLKKDLEFLKYEMEYFKGISESEAIDSLTFNQPDAERVSTSNISDKTGKVSLIYKEHMKRVNSESKKSIEQEIVALEYELKWFEYAIDRLNKSYAEVVRDMFMTDMNWEDVCIKYSICRQTLGKYRRRAVKEIIDLFERQGREALLMRNLQKVD